MAEADKEYNSSTTAASNESSLWEHLKGGTSKQLERNMFFINDSYTLNKTAIHDTVIRLENTSLFLSNAIVSDSRIFANGKMDYSVLIENSQFENGEIVIDSASNVTIMYSQFIMKDIGKEEEPKHVVKVYNTGILLITNTHFGNQSRQGNPSDTGHLETKSSTNLGINLENVLTAELRGCTFTGIISEKSNGSAILLKNTDIFMISCQLYLNMAKHGVIFGNNSVNITSRNSSFISNHGTKSGAVFYLANSCSLTNNGNVFKNNSAREHGGAIYIRNRGNCTNYKSSFVSNHADSYGGAINVYIDGQLINNETRFLSNTAKKGGAIYMEDRGRCINTECSFLNNAVSHEGGNIYGWKNIEVINTRSRFHGNTGQWGGAIYMQDKGRCTNTNCIFQDNYVSLYGGAIYGWKDIEIITTGTRFLSNTAEYGGAIYIQEQGRCTNTNCTFLNNSVTVEGGALYGWKDIEIITTGSRFINNRAGDSGGAITSDTRGKYINIGCVFIKNNAAGAGGAMAFWRGINCTNINCHFTQNSGIFIIR